MFRVPRLATGLRTASSRRFAAASTLPVPTFKEVKFQKEDVDSMMAELPAYNFYEMNVSDEPNPYKDVTMDRSILLDPPTASPVKGATQFSKLENGLKIASFDKGGLEAQVGLFVSAGSRFETAANFGVAHMTSLMAFSSTAHLSQLRTVKTLEQLGADKTSTCTAGPEETVYHVGVAREYVPLVVPLLIGNVLFPRLLPWEVKAAHAKVAAANEAMGADDKVSELLRKAAFCNNTLGLSTKTSERSMAHFTPETVRSYMLDHFAPERMVLVGVNCDHDVLSKWAMRSFADYNAIPMKKREAAKALYTGGDIRAEDSSPFCHLAIALESVAWGSADLAPVAVMQALLGGGSAAVNSVGSGSLSRLNTQVIRQNPYVESCAAFNTSYSDSGLFGAYGVSHPEHAGEMATAMCNALKGLKTVSADELKIAKASLKGQVLREADSPVSMMKDMGHQLSLGGVYGSPSDFAKLIDGVTEAQVTAAATKLLASRPTVAAVGDTHAVPHYGAVEAALKGAAAAIKAPEAKVAAE